MACRHANETGSYVPVGVDPFKFDGLKALAAVSSSEGAYQGYQEDILICAVKSLQSSITSALLQLRFLDHYFRVLFPAAYLGYVLFALSQVGFGAGQEGLMQQSACYLKAA